MKTVRVHRFTYKSVFGEKIFDSVTLLIPDDCDVPPLANDNSWEALDYSIPAAEIKRMERALALDFFARTYRAILKDERTLSVDELRGIQDVLGVNRSELGKLLGLHKGSVTNLFKGKAMKASLCILIMERLGMELGQAGSARLLLDGSGTLQEEYAAQRVIHRVRFEHDRKVAS